MDAAERACLAIADISGYTGYLTASSSTTPVTSSPTC
jgi:hypothetical protein